MTTIIPVLVLVGMILLSVVRRRWYSQMIQYMDAEDDKSALKLADRLVRVGLPDSSKHYNRALVLMRLNQIDRALQDLKRAVNLASDNTGIRRVYADVLISNHQYDEALLQYNYCINFDPTNPSGYLSRANLSIRREDAASAKGDIQTVEAIVAEGQLKAEKFALYMDGQSRHDYAYSIQGMKALIHMVRLEFESAIAIFDALIEHYVKDSWSYSGRGETYFMMGNYEQALADFEYAAEIRLESRKRDLLGRYEHIEPLAGKAIALFKLGQVDEAKELWQKVLEDEPRAQDLAWLVHQLNWKLLLHQAAQELQSYE